MTDVTREQLHAYLDDALDDAETARIEKLIRGSAAVHTLLGQVRDERDRGEHTLGAVWRRERLSCPTREQLGSFLHEVLDAEHQAYIIFHIQTVGCSSCQANLDDLKEKQAETTAQARRRRRYFDQSARLLNDARK